MTPRPPPPPRDAPPAGAGAPLREGLLAGVFTERFLVWADEAEWLCSVPGRLKRDVKPVVGDRVAFAPGPDGTGVVERFLPRETELVRSAAVGRRGERRRTRPQVLAANVDQLVIVAAVANPPFRPGLVERLLVAAHRHALAPLLCITKLDLATPAEVAALGAPYAALGLPVVGAALEPAPRVAEVAAALAGHTSVLVGHSGVGKTSLLNALAHRNLAVGEVGYNRDRGRHTTSMARLVPLQQGGYAIDSPGVREFTLHGLGPAELALHYPDFAAHRERCGFRDCLHRAEPGCAVRAAAEAGRIAPHRYANYLKLLEELLAE